jgi:NAD kinase
MGDGGIRLNAPLAPGLFAPIGIKKINRIPFEEIVQFEGPGVLALDGERERIIQPGQKVELRVSRSGPRVLDINIAMKAAASGGLLRL